MPAFYKRKGLSCQVRAALVALTHDTVWTEDTVANSQDVPVPVVYLAQASGRLAPSGALIAGNDVSLIVDVNL